MLSFTCSVCCLLTFTYSLWVKNKQMLDRCFNISGIIFYRLKEFKNICLYLLSLSLFISLSLSLCLPFSISLPFCLSLYLSILSVSFLCLFLSLYIPFSLSLSLYLFLLTFLRKALNKGSK